MQSKLTVTRSESELSYDRPSRKFYFYFPWLELTACSPCSPRFNVTKMHPLLRTQPNLVSIIFSLISSIKSEFHRFCIEPILSTILMSPFLCYFIRRTIGETWEYSDKLKLFLLSPPEIKFHPLSVQPWLSASSTLLLLLNSLSLLQTT